MSLIDGDKANLSLLARLNQAAASFSTSRQTLHRDKKMSIFPCVNWLMMEGSFWVLPTKEAWIPFSWSFVVWSCIRLIVGVITIVALPVIRCGIWKHMLFPDPVGWMISVFLPSIAAWIICICQSLNWPILKCFTSFPVAWASSWSVHTNEHDVLVQWPYPSCTFTLYQW